MSRSMHKTVVIKDTIPASAASGTFYCRHWSKSYDFGVLHLAARVVATANASTDCVLTIETDEASPTVLGITEPVSGDTDIALGTATIYNTYEARVDDDDVIRTSGTAVRVRYTGTLDTALIVDLELTCTEGHD